MDGQAATAVLLVDRRGRVLDASPHVEAALDSIGGARLSCGRLVLEDADSHTRYRQAVRDGVDRSVSGRPPRLRRIPLAGSRRQDAEIVVQPGESDPTCSALDPGTCVVLIEAGADPLWSWAGFRAQHRLTQSEAALIELLARGESLRSASEQRGLTFETARTYLKRVFAKTGARRQADLLRRIQRFVRG